jgi:hypothetical protein
MLLTVLMHNSDCGMVPVMVQKIFCNKILAKFVVFSVTFVRKG